MTAAQQVASMPHDNKTSKPRGIKSIKHYMPQALDSDT